MITLYPWQQDHTKNILQSLQQNGIALDASDTGIGKTYIASYVAKEYNHPLIVICPKAVILKWKTVLNQAGVTALDVLNVEKLKRSKYLIHRGKIWIWNLAPGTLVIFDEAHNYGGVNSENSRIMMATRIARLPVLAVSATIAYSPLRFRALGFLMGLFPSWFAFWEWSLAHGAQKVKIYRYDRGAFTTIQFFPGSESGKTGIKKIHEEVFGQKKGWRLSVEDAPGFPENQVYTEKITYDAHSEIKKDYIKLAEELKDKNQLTKILELRQHIELAKIPDIARMINDLVEERGVVVFLNFRESVNQLACQMEKLKPAVIIGDQEIEERESERVRFIRNETPLCICTFGAGGLGLDLHDLYGKPRISLINPTWSAVQFIQALGRIHRVDAKSPAVQKILFAAGTVEEDVAARVENHLENLTLLQDGDLTEVK